MKHIIVGNGVAGVTAAQMILRADSDAEVHIFGAEPYPYYRRPLLWEFIAGQIDQDALYFRPEEWYVERGIDLHLEARVTALEPEAKRITLTDGVQVTYDRLLLAVGSHPFVPPCEGTDREGVFTLRTLDDALAIKAYAEEVSRAIVIGGGLLGLETARALHTAGLNVTVIEFAPYLLPRQLDEQGAEVLQSLLEAQGLRIITGGATEAILCSSPTGHGPADAIRLEDGRRIEGELVLFSTGIRSNQALAEGAGLETNRGVVVNEQLRTSTGNIFAVGDVAEFEGRVYGIIPAAIEQARVAAANMVEPGSSNYAGTLPSTTLKVAGAELTSLGESTTEGNEVVSLRHADTEAGHYRKFVLRTGRIIGAILLNDKERTRPVAKLIEQEVNVSDHTDRLLDDDFDLKSLT